MRKKRIAESLARLIIWYNRGIGLTGIAMDIVQKFFYVGGSLAIFEYLFGIKITPDTVKVIVPVWVIGSVILGYVDYKVGFAKVQNSIQNSEYTPFFADIDTKIDELKRSVDELNKKNNE